MVVIFESLKVKNNQIGIFGYQSKNGFQTHNEYNINLVDNQLMKTLMVLIIYFIHIVIIRVSMISSNSNRDHQYALIKSWKLGTVRKWVNFPKI